MIGRNTWRAIGLALACATSFAASGALAQRPAGPIIRVAPQPQTQPPPQTQPQTNPQLKMNGVPQLYAVDTIKLEARVRLLEQQLTKQQDQIATQQQQISTLILQLGNTQNSLTALDNKFTGHKHKLTTGVTIGYVTTMTCTASAGGYPSCKPNQWPGKALLSTDNGSSSAVNYDLTTTPVQ